MPQPVQTTGCGIACILLINSAARSSSVTRVSPCQATRRASGHYFCDANEKTRFTPTDTPSISQ
jgi:hypothetical protein